MSQSAPARDVVLGRIRKRWLRARHEVVWLFLLALAVRAGAAWLNPAILNDSVTLLRSAERLREEGLTASLTIHDHPFVPWIVGVVRSSWGDETFATALSVFAGAFAVWPLHVLARRACGRHAATAACILYAALPKAVGVTSVPLTSAVFLPLFLSAISLAVAARAHASLRRRAVRLVSAGLMAGAAYLARPEGLLAAFAAIAAVLLLGRRRRLAASLVVAGTFLVCAAPYAVALSAEAGHLAVSPKKDLARFVGAAPLASGAKHAATAAYDSASALASAMTVPLLALSLLGGFRPARWRHWRAVTARILLLGTFAAYVAALFRLQTGWGYGGARHMLPAALLLLPFAGEGLTFVAGFLRRPVSRRRLALVLASYFAIPCVVWCALRPVGEDQEDERRLGEAIARVADPSSAEVVIASFREPLVAYYTAKARPAGARDVPLWGRWGGLLERADLAGQRAELAAALRREGAQWFVVDLFETHRNDMGETLRPGADLAAQLVRDGVLATPVVSPGERLAAFPVRSP